MNESALILRIVIRWFLVLLSCSGVAFMFYYFACAICKKKSIRIALVGILILISVSAYVLNHRHPDVVRMREDTLYIKPSSNE